MMAKGDKAQKMEAFVMKHNIDTPFMQQLESKNEGISFKRIDADLTDTFKSKTSKKAAKELEEKEKEISEKLKKALKNDKLVVKLEKLKDKKVSSIAYGSFACICCYGGSYGILHQE